MIGNPKTGSRLETPVITVSESGLITAKAGKLSSTYQLPTQEGKTVVPINSTAEQTAVAKGQFTTGPVYVQSDQDLVASNIRAGVNIFGVSGTYSGLQGITWNAGAITFRGSGFDTYLYIPVGPYAYINDISQVKNIFGMFSYIVAGATYHGGFGGVLCYNGVYYTQCLGSKQAIAGHYDSPSLCSISLVSGAIGDPSFAHVKIEAGHLLLDYTESISSLGTNYNSAYSVY